MPADHQVRYKVQTLLDEHGVPPDVISLDWARQLSALDLPQPKASGDAEASSGAAQAEQVVSLTWADITIQSNGELGVLLQTPAQYSTTRLVEEALIWSGAEENEPIERSLARLTVALAGEDPKSAAALVGQKARERKSKVADSPSKSASSHTKLGSRLRSPNQSQRRRKPSKPSYIFWYAGGAATLGLAILLWVVMSWGQPDTEADTSTASSGRSTALRDTESAQTRQSKLNSTSEAQVEAQAEVTSLSDLDAGWDAQAVDQTAVDDPSSLLQNSLSMDKLLGDSAVATDQPGEPTIDVEESGNPLAAFGGSSSSAEAEESNAASSSTATGAVEVSAPEMPSADVDVMAELQAVAKQAEKSPGEIEMLPDDDGGKAGLREPLIVTTYPMLQVQRLKELARIRAREPAWDLRLETSEGFTVKPAGAQSVGPREFATWVIVPEDAEDDEAVQVCVVAQVMDSRARTIRWRIFANAADVPQIALPLENRYLDGLQTSLSRAQTQLLRAVETLKAMGSAGLPSQARSAAYAQRRAYEDQAELAARALRVVSQAGQMEGWLDGQIQVHAKLRDLADPDEVALIQFGDSEPKTEATAEDGKQQTFTDQDN